MNFIHRPYFACLLTGIDIRSLHISVDSICIQKLMHIQFKMQEVVSESKSDKQTSAIEWVYL